MNALTYRALAALPEPLQQLVKAHGYIEELGDLISECAIELSGTHRGGTFLDIFNRARSRVRRFSQDPSHYAVSIEAVPEAAADEDEPTALRYADYVSDIQRQQKCSRRRAQQLVKQQIEKAQAGDLFAAGGAV